MKGHGSRASPSKTKKQGLRSESALFGYRLGPIRVDVGDGSVDNNWMRIDSFPGLPLVELSVQFSLFLCQA